MNYLTAAQLLDLGKMAAIYGHLKNDPDIEMAILVNGEEKDLAEIGQLFIDGKVTEAEKAYKDGRYSFYGKEHTHEGAIPITNAIYALYLPPYYLFVDLKKPLI